MSGKEQVYHEGLMRVSRLREYHVKEILSSPETKATEIHTNPYFRGFLEGLALAGEMARKALNSANGI